MATLNTLRTRGGWIVTVVIGLALLAFLIGDLAGRGSLFGSGREKVGEIDGESISYMDYARDIDYYTQIRKLITGTEGSSAEEQDAIRNMVWQGTLQDIVVKPGFEKLGIGVSEDEMYDLIYGDNISPLLLNMGVFNDPATGAFDKSAVRNFIANLSFDQTGNMRTLWQYLQDQVRDESMLRKYFGLVQRMVYVTDLEATTGVAQSNAFYNARYVGQPYTAIADSLVDVSSTEVRRFYDERRHLFRQEASRDVEYIVFDVMPSAKDYQDARTYVDNLTAEFAEAENVQQYVTLNSQDAFDPTYYGREQLPADLADYAFGERAGVYGPSLENDVYTLSRVSDVRSFPDTIGFRQIALMPGNEALADSLLGALRAGANFETLAGQHSLIPVDQADAGRISTRIIPIEVGEKIYDSRDKYVLVSNPNAVLLLDVYYRGPVSPKVQIGTVRYYVEPSSATQQAAYAKASAFVTQVAGDYENFNKVAADSVYSKRVARIGSDNLQVTGLENSRELIRWAFNNKPGSISSIMEADGNYVVAALTDSREPGFAPVEEVALQISSELRRQKKADMLAEKMTGAASLDALAQSLSAEIGEATGVNFNSFFIPEVGADPALVGAISGGVPQGQLSRPVKALTGVYVVNITATENRDETTLENEKVRQEAVGQNYIAERAMQALTVMSNIVDNRAKYY